MNERARTEAEAVEQTVQAELAAEPEADELTRLHAIEARLRTELARYGIVHADDPLRIGAGGVEALLRHIYANRDATFGAKDVLAAILNGQREALADALRTALAVQGVTAEDADAQIEKLLRNADRVPLPGRMETAVAPEPLPEHALKNTTMCVATIQGALVIGNYDPALCHAVWVEVQAEVEGWLARTRPLDAPARETLT